MNTVNHLIYIICLNYLSNTKRTPNQVSDSLLLFGGVACKSPSGQLLENRLLLGMKNNASYFIHSVEHYGSLIIECIDAREIPLNDIFLFAAGILLLMIKTYASSLSSVLLL